MDRLSGDNDLVGPWYPYGSSITDNISGLPRCAAATIVAVRRSTGARVSPCHLNAPREVPAVRGDHRVDRRRAPGSPWIGLDRRGVLEQGSRDLPQLLHLGGASEEGLVAHHGVATAAAVCIAEVPEEVDQALGGGKRQAVTITISGHAGNSRIAIMRGRYLIGLSSANRRAAGVATGAEAEVEVELDVEPAW